MATTKKGMAMNSTTIIRQYLKRRADSDDDLGRFPFVTISRQAGSGSRELAEEIIRQIGGKLEAGMANGWQIFDQELCELMAGDPKIGVSLQDLLTEEYHSEVHEVVYDMIRGSSGQYRTYKKVFATVRALGYLGKVVIIGRGGAHVCHDLPLGVHIRLVGSEAKRVEKMARMMKLDTREALKKVRELEKGRARLVQDFFAKDINDPLAYHAVFNIDSLEPAEIATPVVEMIRQRTDRFRA